MRRGLAAVMIGCLVTGCDQGRPPPVIDHGVAVLGVTVDGTVRGSLSVPTRETGQLRFVLTGSIGDSTVTLRGPVIELPRRW